MKAGRTISEALLKGGMKAEWGRYRAPLWALPGVANLCSYQKAQIDLWGSDMPKPVPPRKARSKIPQEPSFVDYLEMSCRGGDERRDGYLSFLRLFANPYGGPDGGDGGNGGHVVFREVELVPFISVKPLQRSFSEQKVKSLSGVKKTVAAASGEPGNTKNRHGANAAHTVIDVPVGTIFTRTDTSKKVKELTEEGELFVGARGGAGGRGNAFFLSNEIRAPLKAEAGASGQELTYAVELGHVADAGLVGFPNAGKSTLLRAVSRAAPKVASYPFTTLRPYIGTIQYDDLEQLTSGRMKCCALQRQANFVLVADIPGIVTGSHKNEGLGFAFLRHIKRCMCLFYVLDLSLNDPWQQMEELNDELEKFKPGLSEKPLAILGNKIDLQMSQENLSRLIERTDLPVFPISAKFRLGLDPVLAYFRLLYEQQHVSQDRSKL